jgi:hypothetical protein
MVSIISTYKLVQNTSNAIQEAILIYPQTQNTASTSWYWCAASFGTCRHGWDLVPVFSNPTLTTKKKTSSEFMYSNLWDMRLTVWFCETALLIRRQSLAPHLSHRDPSHFSHLVELFSLFMLRPYMISWSLMIGLYHGRTGAEGRLGIIRVYLSDPQGYCLRQTFGGMLNSTGSRRLLLYVTTCYIHMYYFTIGLWISYVLAY